MKIIQKIEDFNEYIYFLEKLKKAKKESLSVSITLDNALQFFNDYNEKKYYEPDLIAKGIYYLKNKNSIIGFLMISHNECEEVTGVSEEFDSIIQSMFIFKKFRGKGYGKMLIERAKTDFGSRGLFAGATDYRAREFYLESNFELYDKTQNDLGLVYRRKEE